MSLQHDHRPGTASLGAQRVRRLSVPVGAAVGVGLAWASLAVLRPSDSGPTNCPWRAVTGLDCPFCGATRAASAMAHGDLTAALDHNAFFVLVIVPIALAALVTWLRRAWGGRSLPTITNRALAVLGLLTLAWWLLRLAVPWLASPLAG